MPSNPTVTQSPAPDTTASGQLADLEGSQYNLTNLQYPSIGIGQDDVPSYVTFYINLPTSSKYFKGRDSTPDTKSAAAQNYDTLASQGKFQSPTFEQTKGAAGVGVLVTSATQGLGEAPIVTGAQLLEAGVLAGGLSIKPKLKRIDTTISLYMPDTVMTQFDHGYKTQSLTNALGNLGKYIAMGGSLKGDLQTIKGIVKTGWENASGGSKTAYNNNAQAEGAGFVAEQTGQVGEGFTDLTLKSVGAALNPQIELIFTGTQNRGYVFSFTFQPRSSQEAKTIFNIIHTFKKYSAAEVSSQGNGRYYIPPGQFDIKYYFKQKENTFLSRISTCVLTNIAVNYSGAGAWATMSDGFPVQIDLQLTFMESDIITRELISKFGY